MRKLIILISCALLSFHSIGQHNNKEVNNANSTSEKNISNKKVIKEGIAVPSSLNSQELFNRAKSQFVYNFNLNQRNLSRKSFNSGEQAVLDQQLTVLRNYSVSSFEYQFYTYLAGNYDLTKIENLKLAEAIQPENTEVWEELLAFYTITDDANLSDKYLNKLVRSNQYEKELFDYASDVIKSARDGVLITHGEKDTYPIYAELKKQNIKLEVLNFDFFTSHEYRVKLKKKGFLLPKRSSIDTKYLAEFCDLNSEANLFLSLTLPQQYLSPIQSRLTAHGLTYAYNKKGKVDKNLWNSLNKNILNSRSDLAKRLSANYIPMILKLFKESNDQDRVELRQILLKILQGINKEEKIEALLSEG